MKIKIFNIILLLVLTFQVCLSQPGNQELTEKYYLTKLRGNISLDIEITDLKSNKGMINVLISDESKNEIASATFIKVKGLKLKSLLIQFIQVDMLFNSIMMKIKMENLI